MLAHNNYSAKEEQKIHPGGVPLKPWKDEEVFISDDEIDNAISQWDAKPILKVASGILNAEQAAKKDITGVLGNSVKAGY